MEHVKSVKLNKHKPYMFTIYVEDAETGEISAKNFEVRDSTIPIKVEAKINYIK